MRAWQLYALGCRADERKKLERLSAGGPAVTSVGQPLRKSDFRLRQAATSGYRLQGEPIRAGFSLPLVIWLTRDHRIEINGATAMFASRLSAAMQSLQPGLRRTA